LTRAEFRRIRLSLGLTQAALAKKLGVKRNTVSRWETGELTLPIMAALSVTQLRAEHGGRDRREGRG
jgi:transcriptional regulator with XRE-family HTH domain